MSSFAFLKQLPTTPNEKGLFSHLAVQEILDGEIYPLQALAILQHIEDTIKLINDEKKPHNIITLNKIFECLTTPVKPKSNKVYKLFFE